MINLDLFFQYVKGRCHGNRFCAKMGQNYLPPALIALSIQNGMGYRYVNGRVNSANDACILCENFVKFAPVTPVLTGLICERLVWRGQKMGLFGLISLDLLDRFSQSLHHTKALWVQMIDLYFVFRFVEGRCHGNQLILGKCHERRLIHLHSLHYRSKTSCNITVQNVRVNSRDDVAISCKNLVNFCRITPEKMELIWERQVLQEKTGVFCSISPDILDGFSQYFHHMKALYVRMMDLYLIFQFLN